MENCYRMKKLTTEEFIEKAKKKHGDRYDYNKVIYKGYKKDIIIICPTHGDFPQTPSDHLTGRGCSDCGRQSSTDKRRMTTEEFIEKATEIHKGKYDYSKVDYENAKTDVIIGCPIHGIFPQRPNHHLQGVGCPDCGGTKKSTAEEFIEKAREVHGNKFDYSKVVYIDNKTDVIIRCSEHGDFPQTPSKHLLGQGCPDCAGRNQTTETFVEKARGIHGNRYDYSLVDYKDAKLDVNIRCLIHGIFPQTPNKHLLGRGCPDCGIQSSADKKRMTTEEFIEKARGVHGNLYDYSKVNYVDCVINVIIGCPKHGDFPQIPRNHLQGQGCLKCTSNISKLSQLWLDSMGVPDNKEHREVSIFILIDGKKTRVTADGLVNMIVYEFYGDYWHGNPERFDPNDIHPRVKKTYGELYTKTQERTEALKELGYTVIEMWESDWTKMSKTQ